MKNHHGGMILLDGCLYGSDEGLLTCLDFKTGDVKWEERKAGKGSIAYADGHLYYRNEGGPIILVEANPKQYVETGRFNQPERSKKSAWPHPIVANGKLYIRDQELLLCYDVKLKQ
jgi:outer membrane protein assembly factor BamB